MKRKLQHTLNQWLEAERDADERNADEALTALFATIPRLSPSVGFADRVLWAIEPAAAPSIFVSWLWRSAIGVAIALASVAVLAVPLLRLLPVDFPTLGRVVRTATVGVTWGAEWLAAGLDIWGLAAQVGLALRTATSTPEAMSALLAMTVIGASALYGLNRLLVFERRTW